jgi:hypothetical protein
MEYLESPKCPCKFPIKWDNLETILTITKTILGTKGIIRLTNWQSLEFICIIIVEVNTPKDIPYLCNLQAFLSCLSSEGITLSSLRYLSFSGNAEESSKFSGK